MSSYSNHEPVAGDEEDQEQPRPNQSKSKSLILAGILLGLVVIASAVVGGICGSGHCSSSKDDDTTGFENNSNFSNILNNIFNTSNDNSASLGRTSALVDCTTQKPPVQSALLPGKFGLSLEGLPPDVNPNVLEAILRDSYNQVTGMCDGLPYQRVAHKITITRLQSQIQSGRIYLDLNVTARVTCTGCPEDEPLFSLPQETITNEEENSERRLQLEFLLQEFQKQLVIEINIVLEDFNKTKYYQPDVPLFLVHIPGSEVRPVRVIYSVIYNAQNDTLVVQESYFAQDTTSEPTANVSLEENDTSVAPPSVSPSTSTPTTATPTVTPGNPSNAPTTGSPSSANPTFTTSSTSGDPEFLVESIINLFKQDPIYAGTQVFNDPLSPEYQAVLWMVNDDDGNEREHTLYSTNKLWLRQRYALVTFYIATRGDSWSTCGRYSSSCDGDPWLTPGRSVCTWVGVFCTYGVVNRLEMLTGGNGLIGTIPAVLSWLTELQRFSVPNNALQGNLDVAFGYSMSSLELVVVANNQLTGSLPAGVLERHTDLYHLDLSGNQYKSMLPPELVKATNLTTLNLGNNAISGTLPFDVESLKKLVSLHLSSNNLEGTIPESLFSLTNLQDLELGANFFDGAISPFISQLTSLQSLQLGPNNLGGTIPEELFKLTELGLLDLQGAQLSGTIPDAIRLVNASLMDLYLKQNKLTGAVPEAFDYLTALETLVLEENFLTGSISAAVCNQRGLRFQQLATLVVDCVVNCSCCDLCKRSQAPIDSEETAPSTIPPSTTAPTSQRLSAILNYLKSLPIYGSDYVFRAPTTPQYQAALWLAEEDEMTDGLDFGDPSFLQRYALATFYFFTGGNNWKLCGRNSQSCGDTPWLDATDECTWCSIGCDDGVITQMNFPATGNDLIGELPVELSLLTGLRRFLVPENSLKGNLDGVFYGLTSLQAIATPENRLEGPIPTGILARNPDLGFLDLGGNQLSGPIPTELAVATMLSDLQINSNLLTGTIPTEIAKLDLLLNFETQANKLSGTIPDELYSLTRLLTLSVEENVAIIGTISPSISKLTALTVLQMGFTGLGGPIPEEMFLLTNLSILNLEEASFSGTIPESLQRLNSSLMDLYLNDNKFTGQVPEAFDYLTALETLQIQGNGLTGSISTEVCNERGLRFQQLATLIVDCVVACDCCDNCEGPTNAPVVSDTGNSCEGSTVIENQIANEFGSEYLSDASSIQSQALEWLLNELQLDICSDNVLQRFIMAYFYLATAQGGPWKSCTPPRGEGTPCYYSLPECEWAGVDCNDDGNISSIALGGYNLTGSLPTELAKLDSLEKVSLHNNGFTGQVPTELARLGLLATLDITGNRFSGTLSTNLGLLSAMEFLLLGDNNLSGSIPTEFGNMGKLKQFTIHDNNLTGEMPSGVCQLQLTVLQADCQGCGDGTPRVDCQCCTKCFSHCS